MANFEQLRLAFQTHQNLEGLRNDLRQNAQDYKQALADNKISVPACAEVMNGDAKEYLRRLQWQLDIINDSKRLDALNGGLIALGINPTEMESCIEDLGSAVLTLQSASKETLEEINAAADNVLASVPAHDSVWK